MGSASQELHILFFPLLAPGHMIPMVDMAKLFASRGVNATVLTTPANAAAVQSTINRADDSIRHRITLVLLRFLSSDAVGGENVSYLPTQAARQNFLRSLATLRQPFDQVLIEHRPYCIVADMFYPWTLDLAKELGIPLLFFHGMSFFALCLTLYHSRHCSNPPLESLPHDPETVVLSGLPHRIELKWSQIPDLSKISSFLNDLFRQLGEAGRGCSGVLVNSFYELEVDYVDHYRKVTGRRAWHVGPVSLCNEDFEEMASRGDTASIELRQLFELARRQASQLGIVHLLRKLVSVFSSPASRNGTGFRGLQRTIHLGGEEQKFGVAARRVRREGRGRRERDDYTGMGAADTNIEPSGGGRIFDAVAGILPWRG